MISKKPKVKPRGYDVGAVATSTTLKDLPAAVVRAFRAKCALGRVTMKSVVVALMRGYATGQINLGKLGATDAGPDAERGESAKAD
jgi:hypothetical protein